jgi:hypothetical protein
MMPAKRTLNIYQGDDYTHELVFENGDDVSDRVFTSQIRDLNDVLVTDFDVSMDDAAIGSVVFTLTDTQTTNIAEGVYVYDIQQVFDGVVQTLVRGRAIVQRQVTR